MTNNIKAGDKVQINTEICVDMGQFLYSQAGIKVGETYLVAGLKADEDPAYNAKYGGYIVLADVEEGYYVMEDFEVVEAGE